MRMLVQYTDGVTTVPPPHPDEHWYAKEREGRNGVHRVEALPRTWSVHVRSFSRVASHPHCV